MDDKAKSLCIAMAIKKKNKKAHGGLISDEAQMEDLGKNLIAESRRERNEPVQEYSKGGMAEHIAKMVMKKMSKGGMVDQMDNEEMPVDHDTQHDDFLSDEQEDAPFEDPQHVMRGRIHKIMSGLHSMHKGR